MCFLALDIEQLFGYNSIVEHSALNKGANGFVISWLEITACPPLPMRRNGVPRLDGWSIAGCIGSKAINFLAARLL